MIIVNYAFVVLFSLLHIFTVHSFNQLEVDVEVDQQSTCLNYKIVTFKIN